MSRKDKAKEVKEAKEKVNEDGTIELDAGLLDENADLQKIADELGGEHKKSKERSFFGKKNKDVESSKKIEHLNSQLKEKDEKIKELDNSLKLMVAENRNQKTRIENEFRSKIKFAQEDFFRDFITVKDDFDKAMEFAPQTEETVNDPFIQGIRHLMNKTEDIMKKHGLEVYDSIGVEFDPSLHQAMSVINVEGKARNEIVAEYVRGYKYNNRVLRPSMVIVASGVIPETENEKSAQEDADNENTEQ